MKFPLVKREDFNRHSSNHSAYFLRLHLPAAT